MHIFYIDILPTSNDTFTATYADKTVIIAVGYAPTTATVIFLEHLERMGVEMRNRKIKLDEQK